jgi:cardiolipin synthase C
VPTSPSASSTALRPRRAARVLTTRGLILGACALLLGACALPSLQGRPSTLALRDTVDTGLARATASEIAEHPNRSGIYPLRLGPDAFAARALLARSAERSIDAQYYIWKLDHTGTLLFAALWDAANRGVRVRLLLDDHSTAGLDPTLATLAAHKNIEVRLFNPLVHRRARWTNYLFDFTRVNHRMHNKSFTVDNQVTIVGGRNVGDEYFGAGSGSIYDDFDVVGIGPVVNEVSGEFDLFWNSASAYPVQELTSAKPLPDEQLEASFVAMRANPDSQRYLEAVREARLVSDLESKRLLWNWVGVRVVSDLPSKVYDTKNSEDMLLLSQLIKTRSPTARFDLVSPYFVPGSRGTKALTNLTARGVRVRVLTNSLESADVIAVHGHYAKRRKALLKGGLELWELRRGPGTAVNAESVRGLGTATGLHAKTFQIDGTVLFVGSFNFDRRSARLNTEMGLLIESPALASQLASFFDTAVPTLAYEVRLNQAGDLRWIESSPCACRTYERDPRTSAWRRAEASFFSVLPIDWLL